MQQPYYGIYEAIVTDNTNFFTDGKIKVRIQIFYTASFPKDLTVNYNKDQFSEDRFLDTECLVRTPLGGGDNYGALILPQINSVGIVQFLNGNIKKPIWMGSYHQPFYDDNGKIKKVNIPNDQSEYEGPGTGGSVNGQKNISGDFGTLILRTKQTSDPIKDDEPKNMDWGEQRSENLIVVSKDKIQIRHFLDWKAPTTDGASPTQRSYQDIEISGNKDDQGNIDDKIVIKKYSIDDNEKTKQTDLTITEDNVSLNYENQDTHIISSVGINDSGIILNAQDANSGDETTVIQNPTTLTLTQGKANLLLENNEVIAQGDTIRLSGQVIIGEGGGYILTADTKPLIPKAISTEFGFMIKISDAQA